MTAVTTTANQGSQRQLLFRQSLFSLGLIVWSLQPICCESFNKIKDCAWCSSSPSLSKNLILRNLFQRSESDKRGL
jgi:hypothetical protein